MLKTNHLQMPTDNWHHLHNLAISLENAISSCSDTDFGSDVRWEIQGIIERAEKRIQSVLDKNFAVKPKDFDKYHIITWDKGCGEWDKDYCRTLAKAKNLAKGYFNDGHDEVVILKDHGRVWVINKLHKKGYDPRK